MENEFKKFIAEQQLCAVDSKLLLAVSGGLDSMCMAHLFYSLGYHIGIAHINHGLRGKDSDEEEAFVRSWSKERNIVFYSQKVNVIQRMEEDGMSLQEAARDLRYAFLEEVATHNGFDFIATAHHFDDSVETILFHLFRGTGLKGLRGIPVKRGKIIRPLLFASRSEIQDYAIKQTIPWKEDSSNSKADYIRNQIRLNLMPQIEAIFPDYRKGIWETRDRINRSWGLLESTYKNNWDSIIELIGNNYAINVEKLLNVECADLMLAEYLGNYGFKANQASAVLDLAQAQPGKRLVSDSHTLLRDRQWIFILPNKEESTGCWHINESLDVSEIPSAYGFDCQKTENESLSFETQSAYLDESQLMFPLELRTWRPGDKFQPLGMKGFVKISDFLTQQKLALHHKKNVLVLCSGGQILWLVGFRVSEVARLQPGVQKLIKFSVAKNYYQR
jgi:tRNA(Ile)-lysidine synthase